MRSLFFFVPLAILLAHCDFSFTRDSHTEDECALDGPVTCDGNSRRYCELVPDSPDVLNNRWEEEACDDVSTCVDPTGRAARCVGLPCAGDGDCRGKGVCRNQHCALYFPSYAQCGADPQRCAPPTICAPDPSEDVGRSDGGDAGSEAGSADAGKDGGASGPCADRSCTCIFR